MLVLAYHADEEEFIAYPGHDRLCAQTGMKERNLIYTLHKLEARGELRVKKGIGRGNLTGFQLLLPHRKMQSDAVIGKEKMQPDAPFSGEKDAEGCSDSDEKRCNIAQEKVQSGVEKVQSAAEKGAKSTCAYKEMENKNGKKENNTFSPSPEPESESWPAEELPGQLSEYHQTILDISGEPSRHWKIIAKVKAMAKSLQSAGFAVADLRAFERDKGATQLNFFESAIGKWRKDQQRQQSPVTGISEFQAKMFGLNKTQKSPFKQAS